jgi:hypothetical protein
VGIDTPGVGITRLDAAPEQGNLDDFPASLRAFIDRDSEPFDLRKSRRVALLARLVADARALACSNLIDSASLGFVNGREVRTASCRECYGEQVDGSVCHARNCQTGQVLETIAGLCDAAQMSAADAPFEAQTMICPECLRASDQGELVHAFGCSAGLIPHDPCRKEARAPDEKNSQASVGMRSPAQPHVSLHQHLATEETAVPDFDEPWSMESYGPTDVVCDGSKKLVSSGFREGFARRIVACVNFCQGATIEYLEANGGVQ